MTITVDERDKAILRVLKGTRDYGCYCYRSFASLAEECSDELHYLMERKVVRRHCRKLARKGLLAYGKGLWDDEGPAGSGYCITEKGAQLIALLDANVAVFGEVQEA